MADCEPDKNSYARQKNGRKTLAHFLALQSSPIKEKTEVDFRRDVSTTLYALINCAPILILHINTLY
ncbi:uncharacterized [Tachysurus ichikawai]